MPGRNAINIDRHWTVGQRPLQERSLESEADRPPLKVLEIPNTYRSTRQVKAMRFFGDNWENICKWTGWDSGWEVRRGDYVVELERGHFAVMTPEDFFAMFSTTELLDENR